MLSTIFLLILVSVNVIFHCISSHLSNDVRRLDQSSLESTPLSYDPLSENWFHLSFDSKNFMCDTYPVLCNNFLDEIACANRTVVGCAPDLPNFVGICVCEGNPIFQDKSSRIAKEVIDNRIKPEIGWMLEPWATGPPFSFATSYLGVCTLTLARIGCPEQNRLIVAPNPNRDATYRCRCGHYNTDERVAELITDKINELKLGDYPIFSDPTTLSVELSISVVLIVGKLAAVVATLLYLPPIIGFIVGGIAIQDIISVGLIKGVGGDAPHSTPFGEIRIFALIIVIMRAGLGLKRKEIFETGYMSVALSIVPYFAEFGVIVGVGKSVLGYDSIDMGLFASILAALSPSLVIPGMINFVTKQQLGYTPRLVLTSAPIEVVLAIIMFGIFTSLEDNTPNPLYPWVKVLPLYANIILIPVEIIFSSVLGSIVGYFAVKYIEYRRDTTNETVKRIINHSIGESLLVVIVACYTLYALCQAQYIQQTSGILAIFAMTLTMSEFGSPEIIDPLKDGLTQLWVFVEIFLFTTTGINLAFKDNTGPLQSDAGINKNYVGDLVEILLLGTLGRSAGIMFVQLVGYFTLAPHRRDPSYMIAWWLATWAFQWPKATIQATLGGLPYSENIIPGIQGLTKGKFILKATAFAVLFMAPLGVLLTAAVGLPLAIYLAKKDEEAGMDEIVYDAGDIELMSVEDEEANRRQSLDRRRSSTVTEYLVSYQNALAEDTSGYNRNVEFEKVKEVFEKRKSRQSFSKQEGRDSLHSHHAVAVEDINAKGIDSTGSKVDAAEVIVITEKNDALGD